MITTSRKDARKHLATLLAASLVGSGNPAQAVYDCQVGDFGGQSPVVVISSGGSLRERLTGQGMKPKYMLNIHVFVLYADESGAWTEAMAEDALDDIEEIAQAVIAANQSSAYWGALTMTAPSQTGSVMIGGKEYRSEVIGLRVS